MPALAIPVVAKSEFVCPLNHLEALRVLLPRVTHIAAVGWRAAEEHFLTLLREHVQKHVAITAVCGNEVESEKTLERMRVAGVFGRFEPIKDTFTSFVHRRGVENFLK